LPWYWLGPRAYDPNLERFLQPDPSAQDGVRSYVYCRDDPANCADPSGLGGDPEHHNEGGPEAAAAVRGDGSGLEPTPLEAVQGTTVSADPTTEQVTDNGRVGYLKAYPPSAMEDPELVAKGRPLAVLAWQLRYRLLRALNRYYRARGVPDAFTRAGNTMKLVTPSLTRFYSLENPEQGRLSIALNGGAPREVINALTRSVLPDLFPGQDVEITQGWSTTTPRGQEHGEEVQLYSGINLSIDEAGQETSILQVMDPLGVGNNGGPCPGLCQPLIDVMYARGQGVPAFDIADEP